MIGHDLLAKQGGDILKVFRNSRETGFAVTCLRLTAPTRQYPEIETLQVLGKSIPMPVIRALVVEDQLGC